MRFLLFVLAMILFSCSPTKMSQLFYGDHYSYKYQLTSPKSDTGLVYEDEKMKFVFAVTDKEIDFVATNKSNTPLKVNWDEASFVQFGKAEKVMDKGIKYADRNGSMPATSIPPHAAIDDLVLPTSNVYFSEGYYGTYVSTPSSWQTKDLFITHDAGKEELKKTIEGTNGQEIILYLPVKDTDGKEVGYSFTFKVTAVNCTTCKAKPTMKNG